jgi:DNA-binding transcriptional ArsR family regulator
MPLPEQIIHAIKFGRERFVLADTVVRLTNQFRDDYFPGAKTWEGFTMLLILRRMAEVHQRRRPSSPSELSRAIGMPRTTVQRRLAQLKQIGAVEKRGPLFTLVPEFMNAEHMIDGFKRRRDMWHRAAKKMPTTGT